LLRRIIVWYWMFILHNSEFYLCMKSKSIGYKKFRDFITNLILEITGIKQHRNHLI